MSHEVKWTRDGWSVVTRLGTHVLATTIVESFGEALRVAALLSEGRAV